MGTPILIIGNAHNVFVFRLRIETLESLEWFEDKRHSAT